MKYIILIFTIFFSSCAHNNVSRKEARILKLETNRMIKECNENSRKLKKLIRKTLTQPIIK